MKEVRKNLNLRFGLFGLANGIMILSMMLLSIGMVVASTVASHNENCAAPKEVFFLEEYVWAKVIMDNYVPVTNGILWVCPCGWNGERMDRYPGCEARVRNITIPAGYQPEYCANLGLASTMYNASVCKCYDIIFDANGDGKFDKYDPAIMIAEMRFDWYDSVDEVGVEACTPENGCMGGYPEGSAGFHIYSEASTIILVLGGLVLLFGYIMRKRVLYKPYGCK